MAKVRYVGPLGDGVTVVHRGRPYECPPGTPVELPDQLVHGVAGRAEQVGDTTVEIPGTEALLAQVEDGRPCWELVNDKQKGDG